MSRLAQFLEARREPLIQRWLDKCRLMLRSEQPLDPDELQDSLTFFIDELIAGVKGGQGLNETGNAIAQAHGAQRQVLQRDVADVTREYGLFFESVVEECELVCEEPFTPREYAQLAAALSSGAAEAVREFAKLRDIDVRRQGWEHFAFLAHEIRNPLQTARLASTLIRSGAGDRGLQVLERSLGQLNDVIDRALVDARLRGLDAGAALHREQVDLRALVQESVQDSAPDAEIRRIRIVPKVEQQIVSADPRVLRSALTNLIRNAVKFTRSDGTVHVRAGGGTVEVEDECGGLKAGDEQRIFETFQQAGADRSGFGLGLAIARQAVEAHGGTLSVRNLPGKGCVFTVRLT